jgi:hypothetical protein
VRNGVEPSSRQQASDGYFFAKREKKVKKKVFDMCAKDTAETVYNMKSLLSCSTLGRQDMADYRTTNKLCSNFCVFSAKKLHNGRRC